jgi:hypothetical protein
MLTSGYSNNTIITNNRWMPRDHPQLDTYVYEHTSVNRQPYGTNVTLGGLMSYFLGKKPINDIICRYSACKFTNNK